MHFNLIPWDTEAYLVAADYAEEKGNLISKAIRDKVLPLDVENRDGSGGFFTANYTRIGYGFGWGYGNIQYYYGGYEVNDFGAGLHDLIKDRIGCGEGDGKGSGDGYGFDKT